MSRPGWRVIDTGLRRAAENIALNRALLEAHAAGESPHTLRFLRYRPAALLGYHQSADQELCLDACVAGGVDVQRRITGGGAIYFDETQIGWELYLGRTTLGRLDMGEIARRICEAAAQGIRRLGVDARYRPRNDIEVDGRKISGTGGVFEGDSLLYQGTLLLDFDIERMLRVLRIPAEKLSGKAIASARERMVNLRELLGEIPRLDTLQSALTDAFSDAFGVCFEPAAQLIPAEVDRYEAALAQVDTEEWVFAHHRPSSQSPSAAGMHRCAGGLLRAQVRVDLSRRLLKQVWITGDFFVNPRRAILDLEAVLRDTPLDQLNTTIRQFFERNAVEILLLTPDDFCTVVANALRAAGVEECGG